MRWGSAYLPVPEVLEQGSSAGVSWLLTRGLPGVNATDDTLTAAPEQLVELLGRALARFHRAPIDACPFDFRLDEALARVRARAGLINPARFHPEHAHLSVDDALAILERDRPQTEDRVVCHGDYCLPNILVHDGETVGFVDLGELGVADRHWDLAVATWSATWNLGPGHEHRLLAAYGIEPDPDRIAYYRLLYDLAS